MNAARANRLLIKQRATRARQKREKKHPVKVAPPAPQKPMIRATAFLSSYIYVEVLLSPDNPTKTITSMQKNGFWCVSDGGPMFVLPGHTKMVVLDSYESGQ